MPDEVYEIIALAARYWFLFLMVLIAWRSYRWYARDRKKYKKRLKLLPDAGYIGELVVMQGDETMHKGTCIPVNREGVLGYLRSNDVCVPVDGIANRHLWYTFDESDGLRVEPFRGRRIVADGEELIGKRKRAFLSHGSLLQVGQAKLRLRMFSGFEYAGEASAAREPMDEWDDPGLDEELGNRSQADPVRRMHEMAAWQSLVEDDEPEEYEPEFYMPVMDDEDEPEEDTPVPFPDTPSYNTYEPSGVSPLFYPPVMDDEDAAVQPTQEDGGLPKSMYVDDDEAEQAKRMLWDKYFKGGNRK